jgi:DNA adenine methylase
VKASTEIKRPALRYFGGKWRLADWIINYFPGHTCYCEPFGGGANIILQKPPAFIEVYNDLNSDVVNFFRVLRERGNEFIRAIELTPYARDEYELVYEPISDPFERARRLYMQSWMERGGYRANGKNSGWRWMNSDARGTRSVVHDWNNIGHLEAIVNRLKQITIENDGALEVIERYDTPETLFYLDPPYVQSTREQRWSLTAYAYEMSDDDHRRLADTLSRIKGMAIVSGYPSSLYTEIFAGWQMVTTESAANNQSAAKVEALWLSPRTVEAIDKPTQAALWLEAA